MATVSSLLPEEEFLCSICLEVFNDPVTLPCGHNFCKTCITHHWDVHDQCWCPMCKDDFEKRPELRVNLVLAEVAARIRKQAQLKASASPESEEAEAAGVLCDVCAVTKLRALKSCLMCLTSYCETHLEPHHRIPGLMKHELIDPVENLEGRLCQMHNRPLEMFCKTDQMFLCQLCTESGHKKHQFTPLKNQYDLEKATLGGTEAQIQQLIQERRLKIEKLKQSVETSRDDADHIAGASMKVFRSVIQSVEESLAELLDVLQEVHRTTKKQAEGFINELEEEISKLMKRHAKVEELSNTEDHLQFLQSLPSLNPAPPTKDWTEVRVHSSYEGTVGRAVAQLEETLSKQVKKICADVELKIIQKFAVNVTLDPDTSHPALILSENNKQVRYGSVKQNLPDNPKRFSISSCVLGKTGFSSGRFYYEVQVGRKTRWDLGVARESIKRKERQAPSPASGLWIIWLKNGKDYTALEKSGVPLSLKTKPQKIGVFVDYEEGLVSFYDVDTAALIYSFTSCNFTETVFPIFGPGVSDGGKNSAPLIISAVSDTD